MLVAFVLFVVFVALFFREVRLDHQRYFEADRLGDEHVLREISKFLDTQEIKKNTLL